MSLPEKGEWIEEVTYVGLEEAEAKEIIKKYNAVGKEAGYGVEKRFGRRDERWPNRRNDYQGKNYRERSYRSERYDPRGSRHRGWSQSPRSGGGGNWNRDRRDSRGPPSREWRGSGREHGSRGSHSPGGSYNRNRGQSGGRGGWSGGGGGGGGGWGHQGWNQQSFGSGGGGYSSSQNWGNQWKYSSGGSGNQGYGQQGNYGNWNYYGQYPQNWSNQVSHKFCAYFYRVFTRQKQCIYELNT